MPDNGSGTYSRYNGVNSVASTWENDRDAGAKILASRHDTHDEDMATAISARLCANGEKTPTANQPMGGYLHTNVGEATARTNYARASQAQDGAFIWGSTAAGTADALTLTLSPAITSYATGMVVRFVV